MALINGIYVLVTSESIKDSFEKTEHQVETGSPITDHVSRGCVTIDISGVIMDSSTQKANTIYETFRNYARNGTIVKFVGRNTFANGLITALSKDDDNKIANGTSFSMTIEEFRVSIHPFQPRKTNVVSSGTKSVSSTKTKTTASSYVYHTVKKGDCLWNIAKKYGTTLKWILAHNKVPSGNPNLIYPGEKYRVK